MELTHCPVALENAWTAAYLSYLIYFVITVWQYCISPQLYKALNLCLTCYFQSSSWREQKSVRACSTLAFHKAAVWSSPVKSWLCVTFHLCSPQMAPAKQPEWWSRHSRRLTLRTGYSGPDAASTPLPFHRTPVYCVLHHDGSSRLYKYPPVVL